MKIPGHELLRLYRERDRLRTQVDNLNGANGRSVSELAKLKTENQRLRDDWARIAMQRANPTHYGFRITDDGRTDIQVAPGVWITPDQHNRLCEYPEDGVTQRPGSPAIGTTLYLGPGFDLGEGRAVAPGITVDSAGGLIHIIQQ